MVDIEAWLQLIRRAYGVPDIVRPELASEALAKRVLATIDPDIVRPVDGQKALTEIERIVNLVAEDADGVRDRFILDFPIPFGGLPNRSDDPLQFAAQEFLGGPAAAPLPVAAAIVILDTVKEFVLGHKFQADCGCYFNN
jgi:hypothetical protein